mmetsp:Transcript_21323/g.31677  ORF Transcript_21323/g.31677 Transcript_21323/m.31677 type:complete len:214 (-) Transcript_21323:2613-3254(-)
MVEASPRPCFEESEGALSPSNELFESPNASRTSLLLWPNETETVPSEQSSSSRRFSVGSLGPPFVVTDEMSTADGLGVFTILVCEEGSGLETENPPLALPPIFGRLFVRDPSSSSFHSETSSPRSTAVANSRLLNLATKKFCFMLLTASPNRSMTLSCLMLTRDPGFDLVPVFFPVLLLEEDGRSSSQFGFVFRLASSSVFTSLMIFSISPGM